MYSRNKSVNKSVRMSEELSQQLSLMAGSRSVGTIMREILEIVSSEFMAIATARNCSEDELKDLFASVRIVPKASEVHSINLVVEDAGVK